MPGNPNAQGIREVKRLLAAGANPQIANREGHLEWLLDQALEATFPASDPIAVSPPPK